MNNESFYIETEDGRYFCCSPTTGLYFTEDTSDLNIIDGSELPFKFNPEDTIQQIAEQVKMKKGTQFSRKDLFQHPSEKAWLSCSKEIVRYEDEEKKTGPIREYVPVWSRKFKLVTCISKSREKCQGNASWRTGSKSVKLANEKSRLAKKKRLENATEVAKKLNFDPLRRLALYAMGDKDGLGLSEDVKQGTQMKALETFLKYSHQQLKPFSPQEVEKLQSNKDVPVVHVTLPSNDRELGSAVIAHDSREALDDYFKGAYKTDDEEDEYALIENEAGEYDEATGSFVLPGNGR